MFMTAATFLEYVYLAVGCPVRHLQNQIQVRADIPLVGEKNWLLTLRCAAAQACCLLPVAQ